ncbi:protein FAM133B-like [Pocillopora damicornis]|uniref:protein FAM133B-like n=1 Tax=Pocillopora damicornis TaxID=46731 RepID=UPI000F557BF2|nr:protein FAM133B-like [Pocillopora damicornis]
MGKRDKRVACMNPIAMARARGPVSSGPTVRDYLNRNRPTLEEVKEMINKKKTGSETLAAYEEHLNQKFRNELKKNREKLLGSSEGSSKTRRKERKLLFLLWFKRPSSSSSSMSTSDNSESEEEYKQRKKSKKSRKKRKQTESDAYEPRTKKRKRKHRQDSNEHSLSPP